MIGIGVIGYGYWGPNLARAAAETQDTRLVAVADFSAEDHAMALRYASGRCAVVTTTDSVLEGK